MSTFEEPKHAELESRAVAEAARQEEWHEPSILRELFLGHFRLDLFHEALATPAPERAEFRDFFARFKSLIDREANEDEVDATGEYPERLVEGLKQMRAFAMKIPPAYGGLGFNQREYNQVMEYLGSVDGNVTALLSAHQSIGVPQPIKLFGTDEQKKRLLPRLAAGALSAFALTEPGVGSDPANLATTAELTPDGNAYILNGEKLWCTNGSLAELLVVMARDPRTRKISAFVVEASSPGVSVPYRSRFMGLKAISNAVIRLENVRVPKENLIGREGAGLKIALATLNTGRLTIPAVCVGSAKTCLEIVRRWASIRAQWGLPVGRHDAVAQKIAGIAATTWAMESLSDLAATLADRGGYDIRLEAAAAKEWNSTRAWRVVDETLQIRGGRGYETALSLKERGEVPVPLERIFRDLRINTIFEGSSEIMHLFMAREAVDRHLQVAGVLVDRKKPLGEKLAALPRIGLFYAGWYARLWLGWGRWPRFADYGALAAHLRFVERRTRKLAREVFHGMVVHGARLERRQAFLFRIVDIGLELFTMAATILRTHDMARKGDPNAPAAGELTEVYCRDARQLIDRLFRELWHNHDAARHRLAKATLEGAHRFAEEGIRPMPWTDAEWAPWLAAEAARAASPGAAPARQAAPAAR